MKSESFEKYQNEIENLILPEGRTLPTLEQISQITQKYQAKNPDQEAFLQGEQAFYSERYEKSLYFYLKAKSIPNYEFYCFRASAYAAQAKGLIEQAKLYIEKANQLFPNDPSTRAIASFLTLPTQIVNAHVQEEEVKFTAESTNHDPFKDQEIIMNTDASVFSFPKSHDPATTAALTERLYPGPSEEPLFASITDVIPKQAEEENALAASLQSFKKSQSELLISYLQQSKQRQREQDHCLYILQGWNFIAEDESPASNVPYLLTENLRKTTGGYFIRWNGKGIVINPGKNFLDNFHRAGLHVKDIDFVIVTSEHPDVYADIRQIYDLNYHLNRVSNEHQIIHYYLNQKAHQELAHLLKPNFKQERNTVHSLELFLDSPDVEKVELSSTITLHYFPTSALDAISHHLGQKPQKSSNFSSTFGIKLDLKHPQEMQRGKVSIGYVSGAAWSPLIGHHLGKCDLLLAGLGSTNPNDYARLAYNHDCLGYHGVFSLFEEVVPKLLLCTEFDGRDGDIRLETIKKMRQDQALNQSHSILPADVGLFVDLKSMRIQCSVTHELLEPSQAHVVRCSNAFGPLNYLAPSLSL